MLLICLPEAKHFYIFSYFFLVCTTLLPNNMLIFKNMHLYIIFDIVFVK